MGRLKELKYFSLVMLLCAFVAAGTLTSCREQKKEDSTEQAGDHPEGEEHPTEDAAAEGEHPEGEEHPAKEGEEEHPEGEEHPAKDSVSG